jgi:aspartate aminotransferase/aminotransferase
VLLISDEVYRTFAHESPAPSPAEFNPDTLVIDGFSKSHGMTGWRLGYAHGPARLVQEMAKLQQFSFICAPAPLQEALLETDRVDMAPTVAAYRAKRDRVIAALGDLYQLSPTGGAFYMFPRVPERYADATAFAAEAVKHDLLVIPGSVFSRRDTHFRISYAVDNPTLDRGLHVLRSLAR